MIDHFVWDHAYLSNFFPAKVRFEGILYQNAEAAFHSAKVLDTEERKKFCQLEAKKAKALGRKVQLRPDWEEVKDNVMFQIVRDKFIRNPNLGQFLKETGDTELVEGNSWGDTYWGVCNGKGKNKLGKILMRVRKELAEKN